MLYRSPYGNAPSRLEYRLTEKGLAFYPVALCMWVWEKPLGRRVRPAAAAGPHDLRQDAEPDARLQSLRSAGHTPPRRALRTRARRHALRQSAWRRRAVAKARRPRLATASTRRCSIRVDTVGDRWTALLVGIAFLRPAPLRRHQRGARHRDEHPRRPAAAPAGGGRDRAAPLSGQPAALRIPRDQEGLGPAFRSRSRCTTGARAGFRRRTGRASSCSTGRASDACAATSSAANCGETIEPRDVRDPRSDATASRSAPRRPGEEAARALNVVLVAGALFQHAPLDEFLAHHAEDRAREHQRREHGEPAPRMLRRPRASSPTTRKPHRNNWGAANSATDPVSSTLPAFAGSRLEA